MSNQNYSELAEHFMRLWQQQMQKVMKDGDFIRNCVDGLQNMASYANAPGYDNAKPAVHNSDDAIAYELRQLNSRLKLVEAKLEGFEQRASANVKRDARGNGRAGKKTTGKSTRNRKKT